MTWEENILTFKRFKWKLQQNEWGCGLFSNHDPLYDHSAQVECELEDVLSCSKEILETNNVSLNLKRFAKCRPFREASEL
jgi:hypothetical protein